MERPGGGVKMPDEEQKTPTDRIEGIFRSGSMTVVGIILGFSMGFICDWSSSPQEWHCIDLLAVVPIVIGIALQIKSLANLLSLRSLERDYYNRSKNIFLWGLFFVALGVTSAIIIDVWNVQVV